MPLSIVLQKSSGVAILVLSSFLAYQFALLTWSLFPEQEAKYQWVAPQQTVSDSNINTGVLQQQHLFGEVLRSKPVPKKSKKVSVAPKTKLNVTLVGVVAASDPDYSSAIIDYKGQQDSYFIDSKIEGTRASVSEIYEDRVILNVDGLLQTLMLDGIEEDKGQKSTQSHKSARKGNNRSVNIKLDRQELIKDPGKLTDYVRISPYRKDGEVLGYRLKPGKNAALFKEAGFERNDLAVELNGVDLTDTQQAFSLMKEFPTMKEISVTVERDGQLHELSLNIP